MKIAFDWSLAHGRRAGIGQYSYNLANALGAVDRENEYILYVLITASKRVAMEDGSLTAPPGNFHIRYQTIPFPFQLFRYVKAPILGAKFREYMLGPIDADIVHSNTFCVPRFRDKNKRLVVTIYDLTVITHPECHQRFNVKHCKKGIEDAIKYADAIIAISEHTKKDLMDIAGAPEDLITVTPLAPAPDLKPTADKKTLEKVRQKYKLPDKYILFLGSLEPRKNVVTLIKSYARLAEEYKKEARLVIAGAKGWLNSPVHDTLKRLGLMERTAFTGYVDSEDLPALYSMARCFVYPSLYEGFGLPVLEAMACGAPVITSNTSSMPEVAGTAARLVDPLDEGELTEALEEILGSKAIREEMRKKGFLQAKKFSWEQCAEKTLQVYKKVYENPRRVKP